MINKLRDKLKNQVVIFDGAIGTEIYKQNFFVNTSFEELCLTAPSVITGIHESYVDAGADVLTTNSYSANRNKLNKFGLGDKVKEINTQAVVLAKQSAGEDTLIAGSVGPIGDIPVSSGIDDEQIITILTEQVSALKEAGIDFLMFETIPTLQDTETAIKVAELNTDTPYVLSFSIDRHGETIKGEPLSKLLAAVDKAKHKPTALGLNCGEGAEAMLSGLELLMPLVDYPVIAQPNAGVPKNVDNRMIYMTSPEYLTTYAIRFVNLGVRAIGGCCGTGPEHIRDIARSVRPLGKSEFSHAISFKESDEPLQEPVPTQRKSPFGRKIVAGEWVRTVEIVPPRGYQLADTIAKARECRLAGVDAINIPDGPRASSRISPIITALQIQREAQIEAILHFCCRDKNLIGMQSDLMGCAAVGINNILFITGDPPKLGDYPFASAVFDVDSIGMVKIQDRLNRGVDLGGKAIDPPTAALIGVGADPNAIDPERELRRIKEKAEAGAEYIITQPVFAVEPLLRFVDEIADLNIPVIAGIWPLASYRNAEFMKNEVPGVVVPDEIMERMGKADTREAQREEGIKIARESVARIRDRINGIQVSAPFGNVNTAIAVLND